MENYTETEKWLYKVAFDLEGHRTLMDSFEKAAYLLSSAKEKLAKARARNRRRAISDLDNNLQPHPLADRKRVRDHHIILQIVSRAENDGLETGMKDFRASIAAKCSFFSLQAKNCATGMAPAITLRLLRHFP